MRTARRCIQCFSRAPNRLIVNSVGKVPRPKASMTNAPETAVPLSIAVSNTLYTMPHGSQPHTAPSATALGRLSSGRSLVVSGRTRRHSQDPARSRPARPVQTPLR